METQATTECYVLVMSRRKVPSALTLIALLLLALLPTLAGLQYHWLGQLRDNERVRMKNNLSVSVSRFREDFDRELTRVYSVFHQAEPSDAADEIAQFQQNIFQWKEAPEPAMVEDIYVADRISSSEPRLRRYDPGRRTLDTLPWPPGLSEAKKRLSGTDLNDGSWLEPSAHSIVLDDAPLLIVPRERAELKSWSTTVGGPLSFTIIALDREYLRNNFIPGLIQKYFSIDGVVEYNVAIARDSTSKSVFYSSDPTGANALLNEPDVSESIGGFQKESLLYVFSKMVETRESNESSQVYTALVAPETAGKWIGVNKLNHFRQDPTESARSIPADATGEWRLAVQHKSGSLDAAVDSNRKRNLGISFGILLLFGVSILTMWIASRRVQRLAKQQIAFVAGVSHELRTPLAVIQSAGANLADGVVESPDQSRRYGRLIRSEGRRLGEMVEKILDFAGIQSQRRVYDLRPTDVADLVRSTMAENVALFENEGFQVEADMPGEEIPALADAAALKSAFQNLIGNAVKYADGNKWLRVSVERLDHQVAIRVQDRGLGIPSADLPHIFEPFFRGRDVVDAQIHGSGLGLSLVKHVIDGHRGAISVISSSHQGATFTITLPTAI